MNFRSVLAGGQHRGKALTDELYPQMLDRFPVKFWWFDKHGYRPHVWQALFHGSQHDGELSIFRHLVAGRRGGKTLSAAWEVLFYALHPSEWHRDAHGTESDRSLWIWMLAKDYKVGNPSLKTLLEVMGQAGLVKGKDYEYNKTERRIEFENGSLIEFKTADDPQSLRGAGLDILWIDEAAFIPTAEAWNVVFPAMTDREGRVITTTTPWGKNWFYEEFFTGEALEDPNEFRIQYTSLDNPFLKSSVIARAKRRLHPVIFKQEFLASFDAMAGIALQGDWLKYWVPGNADIQSGDVSLKSYRTDDGRYRMRIFMGIDPAISLSDDADHFAIAVVGLTEENDVFLIDTYFGRVAFPDQLDLIREWQLKWRPELIGVEANAYQAALAQMVTRMSTIPNVIPIISRTKKIERILQLGPLFKTGKVRLSKTRHGDFIDQWINFDPEKKNQKDDLLDAVEIALGVAGVLLPAMPHADLIEEARPERPSDVARAHLRAMREGHDRPYDPELGSDV